MQEITNDQNSIYFIEPLNYDAYLDLIKNATALINTSIYEGFGMPNLEALSLGVPVICSNIEVFKEVSGTCASYVDPLDEDRLAELMKHLAVNGSTELEKKQRIERAMLYKIEIQGKKLVDLVLQNLPNP